MIEVPKRFQKSHRDWALLAMRYQIALFLLGFVAVTSSIIVAGFTKELGDFGTRALAVASALSTGYLSYFQVQRKQSDYWKGWQHLNRYLTLFEAGKIDLEKLGAEYANAETMVGVPELKPEVQDLGKKE